MMEEEVLKGCGALRVPARVCGVCLCVSRTSRTSVGGCECGADDGQRSMLNMVMARMQASVEGGTLTLAGDEAENCPVRVPESCAGGN